MQFIDLAKQYQYLKSKIDLRIQTVLDHGQYIMGPEVYELEHRLAEYVGVRHAITCANGTDALTLALRALEIGEGDAVFVPTFTFFATAESVAFSKATPVFVDCDEKTFNICTEDLEKKIRAVQVEGKLKLKAIIPVDLFGLPANYPAIQKIAEKFGLSIIEDAAQGFGGGIEMASQRVQRSGSFGDIATTSFFPAKPLGCYGDGGAVFTNNDAYAELVRSYRVHGKGQDKYDNVRIGMNSRLDTIQAAILIEKLSVFPTELTNRNIAAQQYQSVLGTEFKTPKLPSGFKSSWAQYTVLAENTDLRTEYMTRLKERGIPSMIYYATCLHQQPAFKGNGVQYGSCAVAEELASRVFSLPMHGYLTSCEVERVGKLITP